MDDSLFTNATQRRRAVTLAVALASGTSLAPQSYERYLLSLFQRGHLTLAEVEEQLELSVYQVLYHSRASRSPTDMDLQQLLAESRAYNKQHQITGLLLYSHGRYVQVLEGRGQVVQALYARIQQDPRHEQVCTLYHGPGAQRRFADWHMEFQHLPDPTAVDHMLTALQAAASRTERSVEDDHLRALLEAFGPHPLAAEVP
ncbi:BLUF domain-containing protein [Hymenobacter wooponensis]|uniref:BLUF domain-containing protein n=1 Tax=Hymenobacter wooponensis TaxID=1525360 RepID=A0A4Z0MBD9_9BACT|nr:BLUF domain-containing protein [Hymenobacter wooponensis]TGD76809.1 BLUF domain-containing protein [Hymenobacter wooponensis]